MAKFMTLAQMPCFPDGKSPDGKTRDNCPMPCSPDGKSPDGKTHGICPMSRSPDGKVLMAKLMTLAQCPAPGMAPAKGNVLGHPAIAGPCINRFFLRSKHAVPLVGCIVVNSRYHLTSSKYTYVDHNCLLKLNC